MQPSNTQNHTAQSHKAQSHKASFKKSMLMLTWGAMISALCANALAAQEDKDNRIYDLGRIEQVSKSSPGANTTVSTITEADISKTMSNDVAQALRYTPGVFYAPAGYGQGAQRGEPGIQIRGFGRTSIGLFLDGVPVHSIYDNNTDFAQFNTFGISEIAVSKGYTSPLYGMNTLGGAINVITSKPKDKLEVMGRVGFVSNNEKQIALSVGSNMGKYYMQASYAFTDRDSLNFSRNFTETINEPDRDKKRNSYYKNHTMRAKVGYQADENNEYSLNFIYQKGEKGGLVNVNSAGPVWDWPNYDKITAYYLGQTQISDKLSLNSKVYYDSFYNDLRMVRRGNGSAWGDRSVYDDYSIGGIFTLGYDFDADKRFNMGVNLRNDNHKNNDYGANSEAAGSTKLSDFSTSIFAEYAQRLNSIFRFALNGSYDRNDVLSVSIADEPNAGKPVQQGWTLQGIMYANAGDYSTFHLTIGKKSKLINLRNRYSTIWGSTVRNPNLQPESGINYEVGYDLDYQSTKFTLAAFYNDMNNMFGTKQVDGSLCSNPTTQNGVTYCSQYVNIAQGYSYGSEVSFQQGLFDERLSFGANYTFTKRVAESGETRAQLGYPSHIVNGNITLAPLKQFDISALATYQDKMWITQSTQNKDIFLVDIKANYRPIDSLQLSVGAYNLLDRNYYYYAGYYQAGRRIYASIEYRF